MSYNQLMDYIQKGTDAEEDPDSLFKFNPGFAKLEHQLDINMDSKSQRITVML